MTDAATPEALFAFIESLGIEVQTIGHPPVHTVEEALPHWEKLKGAHTKNLFLKDPKGGLWLVSLPAEQKTDLKALAKAVGAKRFSFASAELLEEALGVRQGSVSAFALINDRADKRVRFALDEALAGADRVTFHPLVNTMTSSIASGDLMRFLAATGHEPVIVTAEALAAAAAG
ncbi:MAG: prolyl-tRNA synthetase associated domain-containing protein [Parvibaculaceae bacterium]|nr:prolyl-tRNA synthetase associated domain-containing protein [Parvibaculaceae bacterium]